MSQYYGSVLWVIACFRITSFIMTKIAIFLKLSIHFFLWFLAGWMPTQNKICFHEKPSSKVLWTFWLNSKCMAEFLFKSKCTFLDFPDGTSGNISTCQFRRHKRPGFDPWVGKIPWSRKWHHTLVILLEIYVGKWAYWATVYGVTKRHDWVTDSACM